MTYSPVWVVGSGQSGRVQGGDALAVQWTKPFNPAAQDVVDAAAGQADLAGDLAVGPAARQKVAELFKSGLRGWIVGAHAFRVAPRCRPAQAEQVYDCGINRKVKSLDMGRDWLFTVPTPQRCGWER